MDKRHCKFNPSRSFLLAIVCVVLLAVVQVSCDNSVNAFEENNNYSIYGMLNASKNMNYIRVKNLSTPLLADCTRVFNAVVTLTDLKTGQSQILTDSVVQFDSVYTHNFLTTMDISPGSHYQLTVKGPQGSTIHAKTFIPKVVNPNVEITYPPKGRIHAPPPCKATITFKFHPVKSKSSFRYQHIRNPFAATPVKACYTVGPRCPANGCKRSTCAFGHCRTLEIGDHFCSVRHVLKNYTYTGTRKIILGGNFGLNKKPSGITCGVIINWKHFSKGSFNQLNLLGSLTVPGGAGIFGGYYTKSLFLKFPPNPNYY